MNFTVETKTLARRRDEHATFTIKRLLAERPGAPVRDVSDRMDRTYGYRSLRELRWHLADRFGLPVGDVALNRA